ncbi:hypothetical protein CHS0354_032887 [Potamilus streckersoni]|uniref:Tetratricopeptide repeat protein 17 n=1 Tax=Potamilus streckersoni TaxID=2493646 RepID=A0AAE0SME9_9BIVA|nr:hypothetical protein CHS0354_032887 [Potamilus streckersoni]
MATALVLIVSIKLILNQFSQTVASTHWLVTEGGRIQSQVDSVFNLKRPYDLVAFMKQEDRANMLESLKKELLSRKDEIDRTEDRDTGLEQKFYKTDSDCLAAGKHLPDLDLYISTVLPLENKGIRAEDHIEMKTSIRSAPVSPDCRDFMDLNYSFHAFEHLEGMKDREKLAGTPELGLKNAITYQDSVEEYGHRIYEALKQNSSSWVLYNMAAFYWRIKGDPNHVIECVRRALHLSPRQHKDVALISLANVLHRAKYSNEAAIVVHAALDISKELNVNHFTLGNIYAVLGEYNKSVICFENTLKIQPDFEAAAKRKHAVLCHAKLENALEAQHRSLQHTLNDLKDYQRKHDFWQQQNEKLLAEQVPIEVKVSQHLAYEELKIRELSAEIGEYCKMVDRESKQVLMCSWGHKEAETMAQLDFSPTEDKIGKPEDSMEPQGFVDTNTVIKKKKSKPVPDYFKPVGSPLYSKDFVKAPVYGGGVPKYMEPTWPSKDQCESYVQKVPDATNLSSVYLSPENKGYEVKALLTEAQGLKKGGEHPLPWYPPVCVTLLEIPEKTRKTYDHIKSVSYEERSRIPIKLFDPFSRQSLLDHVNEGKVTVEEIGQRILTAIKKTVGPAWILYNLAGLYWRIMGNNYHAIECVRSSLHSVPEEFKDVPLLNLANILYRWGRYEDAMIVMKDALAVNSFEPTTQYFYGNLLWAMKNYTGAMAHFKEALEIKPEYEDALEALQALKCFHLYHESAQSAAPLETETQVFGPNCQRQGTPSLPDGQQVESRVICKNENGEEKCVIETRTRAKPGECDGSCSQSCTVTPIHMDTCGGADPNLDSHTGSLESQCLQKQGNNEPVPDDALFGGDFSSKLDEVSEYYQRKGLCQGEECNQLRVQCMIPMKTHTGLIAHVITPPKLFIRPVSLHSAQCMQGGQNPHIKLTVINGVLHQKLIFSQSPNELTVESHECVIFSDGSKSSGCSRPEYQAYRPHY